MNLQVEQTIKSEYQIGKFSLLAGKIKKKLKRDMEDIHGIVKSRNQMSQKDNKKMNRIKYFKKFPELKKDERLDFETTQSATRKLYIQK